MGRFGSLHSLGGMIGHVPTGNLRCSSHRDRCTVFRIGRFTLVNMRGTSCGWRPDACIELRPVTRT
jgi:hypothetical protein